MKQFALLFFVVLFTMSGCKKEDTVVPDYTGIFVGTWRATKISQNGQSLDLVGNNSIAMYLKITNGSGTNKVSCVATTVVNATITDGNTFELLITKNNDNYSLSETGTSSGGSATYQYTSANGELKVIGIDDKGVSIEFIFKK